MHLGEVAYRLGLPNWDRLLLSPKREAVLKETTQAISSPLMMLGEKALNTVINMTKSLAADSPLAIFQTLGTGGGGDGKKLHPEAQREMAERRHE